MPTMLYKPAQLTGVSNNTKKEYKAYVTLHH